MPARGAVWDRRETVMHSALLDMDRIRKSLRTKRIGRRIDYVETVTSTNDVARALVDDDDGDGSVVLTEYQSAGRGRLGRSWHAPRGASVLMSVLLTARGYDLSSPQLALVCGVALCDAIIDEIGMPPCIKWPNDIILSDKKVGGILVEAIERKDGEIAHIVGIGVNCLQHADHWPAEIASTATSLDLESPAPIDRSSFAIAVLKHLDAWLADPDRWHADELRHAWLKRAEPLGRGVCLRHAGRTYRGTILDIDPTAALVVQLDVGGIRAFNAANTTREMDSPMGDV